MQRRRGSRALGILVLLAIPAGVALIMPWAFHMGGRWTPLTIWTGSGTLTTKSGSYPLFVTLYPSSHFSRLRMEGRRASGGLQGTGCLCTGPGKMQLLDLSGTLYSDWQSTEGGLVNLRLLEFRVIKTPGQRGYFDMIGRWKGGALAMDEGGAWAKTFGSGLRVERAAVTLRYDPSWTCKSYCAGAVAVQVDR